MAMLIQLFECDRDVRLGISPCAIVRVLLIFRMEVVTKFKSFRYSAFLPLI